MRLVADEDISITSNSTLSTEVTTSERDYNVATPMRESGTSEHHLNVANPMRESGISEREVNVATPMRESRTTKCKVNVKTPTTESRTSEHEVNVATPMMEFGTSERQVNLATSMTEFGTSERQVNVATSMTEFGTSECEVNVATTTTEFGTSERQVNVVTSVAEFGTSEREVNVATPMMEFGTSECEVNVAAPMMEFGTSEREVTVSTTEEEKEAIGLHWREGRRIVELGILADGLSGCHFCGVPLHLNHTTDITNCGVSATLKIPCSNTTCLKVNSVPTGKRHGRIWDGNTKLATALIYASLTGEQINKVFLSLNMPIVSKWVFNERTREAGMVIEEYAEETMNECLQEELRLNEEHTGEHFITGSTEAGWQKRGSGRSYDSLSGHSSFIGTYGGKVLAYAVRSKTCRKCAAAERLGKVPEDHDCRRNYAGSSKSMEPDMVEEMITKLEDKGVQVTCVAADDDATTTAKSKQINPNIKKVSEKNHLQKKFKQGLKSLQLKYKCLSQKVFNYLCLCYTYAIAQNKGNPDKLKLAFVAIAKHPFGDHSACDAEWCGFKAKSQSRFKNLPFGRLLTDVAFKEDLLNFMMSLSKNSVRYSEMGSTQTNESFNKMVSTRAPKDKFLSGSAQLNYRVGSSTALKNKGNKKFFMNVYRKLNVSPGQHTLTLAALKDNQHTKRRQYQSTVEAKRLRRQNKDKRTKSLACLEVREGPTYQSGIDLEENVDMEAIPAPMYQPCPEDDPIMADDSICRVVFDLETTGLERDSHITELAAETVYSTNNSTDTFQRFIIPKKPISNQASKITGITVKGRQLFKNGALVNNSVSVSRALTSFLDFLKQKQKVILVGHNIKTFDSLVLVNALENVNMMEDFRNIVIGFEDTRKLFMINNPELKSYSQENLVGQLLGQEYQAHSASEDVKALKALYTTVDVGKDVHAKCLFSVAYSILSLNYSQRVRRNLPSLQRMIDMKVLTQSMARRVAGSGLVFRHIEIVFCRSGKQGITNLFSETVNGKVRVTKCSKIVQSVCDFLSSN